MKRVLVILFLCGIFLITFGCANLKLQIKQANEKIEVLQGYVTVQTAMIDKGIAEYDTVVASVVVIREAIYVDTNVWNQIDAGTQKILVDAWEKGAKFDKKVREYIVKYNEIKGKIDSGMKAVDEMQAILESLAEAKANYVSIAGSIAKVAVNLAVEKYSYVNTKELQLAIQNIQTYKVN